MPEIPLFPEQASTLAPRVDALYFAALAVAVFFSLLIAGLIFYFFVRYRRRSNDEIGFQAHRSTTLEIVWSVIPLVISLTLFVWGARVFFAQSRPPADAVEYFAVGKQWMWKFQHPQGHREINTLHVPVGEPIKLTMTSEDVIHSLFIPAFRVKADVLPGRYTTVWFEATQTGTYHLFCTEYCGAEHSLMGGEVVVMEPSDYQQWLSGGPRPTSLEEAGAELFDARACNTCHSDASGARGPSLRGVYGTEVTLADGRVVVADDAYLRESIVDPGAKLVAGYEPLMPTYRGQLSEESIVHLLAYIKSLQPEGPADVASATAPVDAEQGEAR